VSFFDQSESIVKQNQSKNITFDAIGNCSKERKKERKNRRYRYPVLSVVVVVVVVIIIITVTIMFIKTFAGSIFQAICQRCEAGSDEFNKTDRALAAINKVNIPPEPVLSQNFC